MRTWSPPGSDGRPGVLDEPLLWLPARCISTAWSPSSKSQRRGEPSCCRWSPSYVNGLPPAAGSLHLLAGLRPWGSWCGKGSQCWSMSECCGLSYIIFQAKFPVGEDLFASYIHVPFFLSVFLHICINLFFHSDTVGPDLLQGCV